RQYLSITNSDSTTVLTNRNYYSPSIGCAASPLSPLKLVYHPSSSPSADENGTSLTLSPLISITSTTFSSSSSSSSSSVSGADTYSPLLPLSLLSLLSSGWYGASPRGTLSIASYSFHSASVLGIRSH